MDSIITNLSKPKYWTAERTKAMRVTGFIQPVETEHWRIELKTLTEDDVGLSALRSTFQGHGRFTPPGTYTGLFRRTPSPRGFWEELVMSDTPDELWDHYKAYQQATGRVLINGLGLGCLLKGVLTKPEVTHVDVVEIDQNLIDLVGPYYNDTRTHFYCHDALSIKWPKGTKWDVAWHDIWDNICLDNLETMAQLHRMYGRRAKWQGSWCFEECRRYRDR